MVEIRPAMQREWEDAMDLVWKIFLRFEADEYTPEGVENFWNFIHDDTLRRMFRLGKYIMYLAVDDGQILGVITLRDGTHISLLFVDDNHHREGIGRLLVDVLSQRVLEEEWGDFLTVNASPYGVPFYKAVGFEQLSEEIKQHGIIFTPMKRSLV